MKKWCLHLLSLLVVGLAHGQAPFFQRVYTSDSYDNATCVVQTFDDGYVVGGSTSSWGGGNSDAYIFKLDTLGNCLWSKTYGTAGTEWATDIVETPDSGLCVVGYTNFLGNGGYDFYLLRLDSLGNLLWDTTYGGSDWDRGHSISNTADGGFILAGETYSKGAGNADGWVIKIDDMGTVQWDSTYGGPGDDRFFDLDTVSGGDYFVAGETESFGAGDFDLYCMRLNPVGDTVWTRTMGANLWDTGNEVLELYDGDYLVTGTSTEADSTTDAYTVRFDTDGNVIWELLSGNVGTEYGFGVAQQEWPGQAIILAASTNSFGGGLTDFFYGRYTQTASWITGNSFGGFEDDIPAEVIRVRDNGYVFVGTSRSFGSVYTDVYVVRMNANQTTGAIDFGHVCGTNVGEEEIIQEEVGINLYPNPLTETAQVEVVLPEGASIDQIDFRLMDLAGREVYQQTASSTTFTIHPEGLQQGVYLFNIFNRGAKIGSGKLMIVTP